MTVVVLLSIGQSALAGVGTVASAGTAAGPGTQVASASIFDGTQSQWAEPELLAAYDYGLTYAGILGNYQKPITREEFCIIVVKLYEKLSVRTAAAGDDPFSDTDNPEILKAYKLGIVKGTSATTFSPANKITRQEICVMIVRALEASLPGLEPPPEAAFSFTDANTIASWAVSAMEYAYSAGIMKGVGEGKIAPLQNTSREQAIALIKRTFEKYSGGEYAGGETGGGTSDGETAAVDTAIQEFGVVPVVSGPNPPADEKLKYFDPNRLPDPFLPVYDERLALFASTGPGKPSQKPTALRRFTPGSSFTYVLATKGPVYTSATSGAFVNESGDKKRWFAFVLDGATGATSVVWQVSAVPFSVTAGDWRSPPGLLKSGTVAASAGEFQVDFGSFATTNTALSTGRGASSTGGAAWSASTAALFNLPNLLLSDYRPIPQAQRCYYVRAVPVDAGGNPIGDPGDGLAVVYGREIVSKGAAAGAATRYELWSPMGYIGTYMGEFKDKPAHRTEVGVNPKDAISQPSNTSRVFHFHNLDPAVTEIVIQVSSRPFTSANNTPGAGGLLYEKSYVLPIASGELPSYYPLGDYPASVLVPFGQFGKKASEMTENQFIKYYVRGLALTPSSTPGFMDVALTDTINVKYGFGPDVHFLVPPTPTYQYIDRALPAIKIKDYSPIQWSASDYLQHYVVYRAPTAYEINCCWKNTVTGEVLIPYDSFIGQSYYKAQGIDSAQEYEQIVIPRVLQPGTLVYFPPPKEEDKAWYEELWDGIVEFFEDLAEVVTQLVNQVAAAYNNLKTGLIEFVVDLCPIDSLKDEFRLALEALVNTGLAAMGLPPTLPNFDDLSSMSLEYMAEVALTEAGVPASGMTQEVIGEVAAGIGEELQKAADRPAPNPVNAPFLQLDPAYLYRPAFVDVEISNNSDYPTVAGSFDLFVTFEFDYWTMYANSYNPDAGILFTCPNPYAVGSTAAITTSLDYMNHFLYGLNGKSVNFPGGGTAVYDVFAPVKGQKVPVLGRHESTTVRVYLEPYTWHGQNANGSFTRYPNGDCVSPTDFEVMYFANGNKKFTNFYVDGYFPTPADYLRSTGMLIVNTDPNVVLAYRSQGSTSSSAKGKPVVSSWTAP